MPTQLEIPGISWLAYNTKAIHTADSAAHKMATTLALNCSQRTSLKCLKNISPNSMRNFSVRYFIFGTSSWTQLISNKLRKCGDFILSRWFLNYIVNCLTIEYLTPNIHYLEIYLRDSASPDGDSRVTSRNFIVSTNTFLTK